MTKAIFVDRIEKAIQKYYEMSKRKMRWAEKSELTEFEMLLDDFIDMGSFDKINQVILKRISCDIADELRYDSIIFYYSSFHYFYEAVRHHDEYDSLSKMIYQMNIQINIMRIQIRHGHVTNSSEDDYYFEGRGSELISAIRELVERYDGRNKYSPILYLLLNYIQSLLEYCNTDNKTYKAMAEALIENGMNIVYQTVGRDSLIKKEIASNEKIKFFIKIICKMYIQYTGKQVEWFDHELTSFDGNDGGANTLWVLNNLFSLDKEMFKESFEKIERNTYEYDRLYSKNRIIYLKNYVYWFKIKGDNEYGWIKLPTIEFQSDHSWFKIDDYINGYSMSCNEEITEEDIKKVNSFNAEVLRDKVARIIKKVDPIVIEKEARKPHGPLEIADMELPIRTDYSQGTYYLCIPMKSGKEISGKVREQTSYQVLRPFVNFANRAIVVFISAREVTEAFNNCIKRARANLKLDIYIIDGRALVRLLKYNNLID